MQLTKTQEELMQLIPDELSVESGEGKTGFAIFHYIKQRHEYWWEHLLANVQVPDNFDRRCPMIEYDFLFTARNIATSWKHKCRYRLHHALNHMRNSPHAFDNVIAHEVCHSFASRIYRNEKHGNFWLYLVQVVCGFTDEGRYQKECQHLREALPEIDALKAYIELKVKMNKLQEKVQ